MLLKYPLLLIIINITLTAVISAEQQTIEENSYTTHDLIKLTESIDTLFDIEKHDYDKEIGDEINQVCAGCHGEYRMGGKEGKYPRIAGLPIKYLIKEIVGFRERKRPNIPWSNT